VFLALSKVLDLAVEPLVWGLLLGVAAIVWRRGGRRRAALAVLALVLPGLAALAPVADRLQRLAAAGAARTFRDDVTYDAAVVLSGAVSAGATSASGELELTAAADRVTRALELVRAGRVRHLVLSGGPPFPRPGEVSEPELVRDRLVAWGVPPERILVETGSRNTRENAIETARLLAAHGLERVLLVTSAAHAPRALGCFRAVGLSPDLLPVDHRAGRGGGGWLPRAADLERSTGALRELAGRAVYFARGWTR
jgi:uncharacterized SAM-binding protein YcdF (DUF218 family)